MILPVLLATAAVTPIAPSGPWTVSYEDNMCLLQRNYPSQQGTRSIVFQPLLDLPDMELFLTNPDSSGEQFVGNFRLRVEPGHRSYTGRYWSTVAAKTRVRLTRLSINRQVLDELRDGDVLSVQASPIKASFVIVRPEKARPALDKCVTDLKRSWGIDPERDARAVTGLIGHPASYFGPATYPREALNKGIYGRVIALLNITPDGTVENCRIVSSAGQALNDGTCAAARRIKFEPPRDADGKPLATTYLLPVRWMLPGAPE